MASWAGMPSNASCDPASSPRKALVIVNDVDGQVFAQLIEAAFVDRLKQARDYRLVGFGLCVFHALIVAASCGSSLTPLAVSAA